MSASTESGGANSLVKASCGCGEGSWSQLISGTAVPSLGSAAAAAAAVSTAPAE